MVQFNSLEMSVYISLIIHKKHDILHGGGGTLGDTMGVLNGVNGCFL